MLDKHPCEFQNERDQRLKKIAIVEFTVDRQHQYYINKTLYTISYQSVLKPVKGIAAFESGDSCAVL